MAKDPAVLFYTSDFLMGTTFFTDEQRGQYIMLLCHQHQLGHLPLGHMTSHITGQDSPVWSKFIKDENDLFYNARMDYEKEKRLKYCKSRTNNIEGKNQYSNKNGHTTSHMGGRMENENRNENEDRNIIRNNKKLIRPTIEQVKAYCLEVKSSVDPEYFFNNYESQGWIKANGRPIINWKSTIRTWEKRGNTNSKKDKKIEWNSLNAPKNP